MKKKLASCKSNQITSSQLSGSKALTLHISKAAASISDKLVLHTDRIMERRRSEDNLGSLEHYANT
jgi:hypothetical protein